MARRHHDLRGEARGRRSCSTRWASISSRRASPSPRKAISRPCQEIARGPRSAVICGLARAHFKDIDRCAEAVKPRRAAAHPHLHRHLAAPSRIPDGHRRGGGARSASPHRSRARATCSDDVEWSPMDATRTELDFLCRCVETAIKAGATTINIPDTVGYATPDECASLIRDAAPRVPGADKVDLLDPLPQRPRPGRRQLAGRRRGRRAAGRMHHQRPRRARRQRRAGRGRHGDQDARRRHAVSIPASTRPCSPAPRASSRA